MASPGPSGLSAYSALPSQHSILNHVIRPPVALSVASAPSVVRGFATHEQARRVIPPKQVCHPTDCWFTSSCSPPHLTATQLPSISGLRPTQARTYTTLTKRPHGRTHGSASPIAGHDAKQMTEALIAFRSGAQPSTVMGRIAKGFDADELGAISAWWAAQK
jgi:sulfide dehydrogenase cytochrome subunit